MACRDIEIIIEVNQDPGWIQSNDFNISAYNGIDRSHPYTAQEVCLWLLARKVLAL